MKEMLKDLAFKAIALAFFVVDMVMSILRSNWYELGAWICCLLVFIAWCVADMRLSHVTALLFMSKELLDKDNKLLDEDKKALEEDKKELEKCRGLILKAREQIKRDDILLEVKDNRIEVYEELIDKHGLREERDKLFDDKLRSRIECLENLTQKKED